MSGGITAHGTNAYDTTNLVTDNAGDATMWLYPGTEKYTFIATPPTGSGYSQTNFTGNSITDDTALTLTLTKPLRISGHILDPLGNPLANQAVALFLPNSPISGKGFIDQATVTAVAMSGTNVRLTLDKKLAAKAGYLASNPAHNGSHYQLIHNIIRNNRARGMFLRGDEGRVLNNTIDGSTILGILFTAPEISFGGEADFARNVLVSGNIIKNTERATNNGQSAASNCPAASLQVGSADIKKSILETMCWITFPE